MKTHKEDIWFLRYKSPLGDIYIKTFQRYTDALNKQQEMSDNRWGTTSKITKGKKTMSADKIHVFISNDISIEIII